jgi:phage FluMu protein Com
MQTVEVTCCGRKIRRTVSGSAPVTIRCPRCGSTYKFK